MVGGEEKMARKLEMSGKRVGTEMKDCEFLFPFSYFILPYQVTTRDDHSMHIINI